MRHIRSVEISGRLGEVRVKKKLESPHSGWIVAIFFFFFSEQGSVCVLLVSYDTTGTF